MKVVNLFSYRTTDPEALRTARVDIVGDRTDATLHTASSEAQLTLAAWKGNTLARHRSAKVVDLLTNPMCVGLTKSGEPRHPLYVTATTPFIPTRSCEIAATEPALVGTPLGTSSRR